MTLLSSIGFLDGEVTTDKVAPLKDVWLVGMENSLLC